MFAPEFVSSGLDPASLAAAAPAVKEHEGVLLVEDEPTLSLLLEQLFGRARRRVFIASSGAEALELFAAHREAIGVALIDCHLPDIHGGELCRRLRQAAPGLPLLLTSGRDQRMLAASLTPSGPTGFLPKPYLPGELVNRVTRMLGPV